MLRFFRHVRKQLMEQNPSNGRKRSKTRSYVLYALGEIALVVIGILIALQINNWNEQQKEQQVARQYLREITNDLATDTTQFTYMIELLTMTIDNELEVLSKTEYDSLDFESLSGTILANSFRRSINQRTFNKIQNSGTSNLRGFESLYDSLSNYYVETNRDLIAHTNYDLEQYTKNRVVFDEYVRSENIELPLFTTVDADELKNFQQKYLTDSTNENFIVSFFTTVDGRNYVTWNAQRHIYLKQKYQLYKNEASGLIEQVKKSLEIND